MVRLQTPYRERGRRGGDEEREGEGSHVFLQNKKKETKNKTHITEAPSPSPPPPPPSPPLLLPPLPPALTHPPNRPHPPPTHQLLPLGERAPLPFFSQAYHPLLTKPLPSSSLRGARGTRTTVRPILTQPLFSRSKAERGTLPVLSLGEPILIILFQNGASRLLTTPLLLHHPGFFQYPFSFFFFFSHKVPLLLVLTHGTLPSEEEGVGTPVAATFWVNASRVRPLLTFTNVNNPSIFIFIKEKTKDKNKKKDTRLIHPILLCKLL